MKDNSSRDNSSMEKSYRTFEDLDAYQVARDFRKAMYKANRCLPDFERFELGSQIRRAAVSLTNNIAEGHGRFHYLEQIKFCLNARGSLEELVNDLNVCLDESYLPEAQVKMLKEKGWRVHGVLNGYIRWLREQRQGAGVILHEDSPRYQLPDRDLDDLMGGDNKLSASTL